LSIDKFFAISTSLFIWFGDERLLVRMRIFLFLAYFAIIDLASRAAGVPATIRTRDLMIDAAALKGSGNRTAKMLSR